ncbi:hypothetical protein BJY01DRAFT_29430 [Aspergillus pseudoustus]|uniref:Uncharacterized protein n=1 Tax=Aspergillus pseudoustus TaxID=1810923 RepID=A0ABR4JG87_9EURO
MRNAKIWSTSPDSDGLHNAWRFRIWRTVWRTMFTTYVLIEVHVVCGEPKGTKGKYLQRRDRATGGDEAAATGTTGHKRSPMQGQLVAPGGRWSAVSQFGPQREFPVSVVAPSPHRTTTVELGTGQVEFFSRRSVGCSVQLSEPCHHPICT